MISIKGESLEGKPLPEEKPIRVVVTDVDIKFFSIVDLMVKFVFATIPAVIIIYMVILFIASFMKGCMA